VPYKPDYGVFGPALQITEEPGKPPPLEHKAGIAGIAPQPDPNQVLVAVPRTWFNRWPQEDATVFRTELFRIRGPQSAVLDSVILGSVDFRGGNLPTSRVGAYGHWIRVSPTEFMVRAEINGGTGHEWSVLLVGADGTPIGLPRVVSLPPVNGTVFVSSQAVLPDGGFVFLLMAEDEDGYNATFTLKSRDGLYSLEGPYRVFKPLPQEGDIWEWWVPNADMAMTPDGTLYTLMWVSDHQKPKLYLFRSADGERWELVNRDVAPPEHYPIEFLRVRIFAGQPGEIHILYLNGYQGSFRNRQIMYRYSLDGGRTFSSPVNVLVTRVSTPTVVYPRFQLSGMRRYVLWSDDGTEFYDPERYFNPECLAPPGRLWLTWSDDGVNFHPPVRISELAEGYYNRIDSYDFAVDANGGLHIFWVTDRVRKCGVNDPLWDRVYYLYVSAERINALANAQH